MQEDIPLRQYIEAIFSEYKVSTDTRFRASEIAVNAALAGQEKAVNAAFLASESKSTTAFISSEKAIVKAEQAQQEYNVAHNGLLKKMDDQYNILIPRKEAEARFRALDEKIELIRKDIQSVILIQSSFIGAKNGNREVFAYIVTVVSIITAIAAVIIALYKP